MICQTCIRRVSALRATSNHFRSFATAVSSSATTASPRTAGPPSATSTGVAQPFSTPLSPAPNDVSLGASLRPKPKTAAIPVSSCPAGTKLKGLNFLKGKEDPVALPEEAYPEWLWGCLETTKKEGDDATGTEEGDAFCKSQLPLFQSV
jgi:large subunit ribosomal protein L54